MNKIYLLLTVVFFSVTMLGRVGFAMGTSHVHFVDENYQGKSLKNQPVGESGTRLNIKGENFYLMLDYPREHRVNKWPLEQSLNVDVVTYGKPGKYKFKKFDLHFANGHSVELVDIRAEKIDENHSIFKDGKSVFSNFMFFFALDEEVEKMILEFELEIVLDSGVKESVSREIHLNRASYKANIWEGLNY